VPLVWAAGQSSVSERPNTAQAPRAESPLTLESPCACGHTRLDHTGLRLEVSGRCLQCTCRRFSRAGDPPDTDEATIARIRAAIEKAERMQRVAAELLAASRR
jgi:hypothetical protein